MIKSVVVHNIPLDAFPAMERWYHREHSPEISRRYGPWLARHESYLPLPAPAEAGAYGFYNWRVTECYWREVPEPGPKGALAFTVPPVWPRVASGFVPPQPTEDFLGADHMPAEKVGLRWYILFRYPKGVSREEGEKWFLETHAPEVSRQPGLYRFFSYQVVQDAPALPGVWPAGAKPPADITEGRWDRVTELWYETFSDWRHAVIDNPPAYTKPSWATQDAYPFVEPFEDFVSSFLLERPNDEFLRDLRSYLP
jgi:hypothetical protein